ncbi:hypothetical protein BN12_1570010 [Nostocoides japonicum T1-X7]|uniref:Uncharacterized protein n=1 Tax=Nostocoides japonicum T1-X7 TaxID=1194083 RepID=A0A077LYG1_9MICO|nr:hypothetical protein [Tetrasphaera japonica]CCH76995.1 hypothetical protein BN12_1570010 [Tetrasphaera japonica T1-X7]
MTTTDVAAGTAFYSALQDKAMAAVKDTFKSELYPVQYPAQGDFPWNWQNANGVLNDLTYQYIDALVSPGQVPGTVALSTGGGFANAYVSVLNAMAYALSSGDQQKLNQAQSNASLQAQTIVTDYQSSFGTITDAQLTAAGVRTKQDYVIGYVLGSQWSGSTPPLSYSKMAAARNLKALLPNAPSGGDQVITDVVTYLNIMQPVNALSDELQNGAWMLAQLKANAMAPSASNGGQQTFNPNTGAIVPGYNVGWGVNTSVQSISNDLQNTSRTIEISMTTEQSSGSTLNVNVEGEAGFSIGSWLEFSTEASASYDMSKAQGTSTDCSVTITYAGYSMVALSPAAWQQATNVGFYWADPIAQAVANEGQDVTGFRFVSTPPYTMDGVADGGGFGLLTNLLVANYPTVKVTYSHADYASFEQNWSESVTGNLTLFGFIKLGSFSQGAYGSSVEASSDNSSFTVTFTPSPELVNQPQSLKTAYVISGAVANPGA